MSRFFLFIAVFFYLTITARGQQTIQDLKTIQVVKAATAFVYKTNGDLGGTCFFITLRSKNPTKEPVYLVTSKHVLRNNQDVFFDSIYVRVNYKDTFRYIHIKISSKGVVGKNIYMSDDTTVDVAVVPAPLKMDTSGINPLRLNTASLLEEKDFKKNSLVQEGADVFFTGVFRYYTGGKQIEPMAKFGKIAIIPKEKISLAGPVVSRSSNMILIDCSVHEGNSGSPVYFKIFTPAGKSVFVLGGVVSGQYSDPLNVRENGKGNNSNLTVIANYGIGIVTPVYQLRKILEKLAVSKESIVKTIFTPSYNSSVK